MVTPSRPTSPSRRVRLATVVGLALLAGALAAARVHTFDEPLERDITTYAIIGHEMLAGRELYSDLWDHKPPAIHVTFAAAELLAGYGPREVFLLNVLAGVVTMLGVWSATMACARSRPAAMLAAALWVSVSGDLALQGNQPNTEVFLNACMVWALAILLRERTGESELRWTAAAGALFALGSLYKPVAVAVAGAAAVAVAARALRSSGGPRRAATAVALLALPGAVAWLAVFGWFRAHGRLAAMYDAVFAFNRAYAGTIRGNVIAGLAPARLVPPELAAVLPLAALPLAGLAWLALRRSALRPSPPGARRTSGIDLLLAYAVGTALAIALPGQFFPHYYQLWLPLMAIAAGCTVAALGAVSARWAPPAAAGVGAALLVALVALQAPSYALSPANWSRMKYGGVFVATRRVAATIDALLAPGETFYEWGAESGLYFYTRRDPPTGVFTDYPVRWGPLSRGLAARVIRDLTARPPELVVVAGPQTTSFSQPVLEWVAARYVAVPGDPAAGFGLVLARRGGALAARLGIRTAPPAG